MPDAPGRLLLGIDLGSSALKVAVLDPDVGILATQSHEVAQYSEHPNWSEADPEEWWNAVCAAIPIVLNAAQVSSDDVGAVSVTGMVPAVLVLDDRGRPLRRAILQNDARASKEIAQIRETLGDLDLLERTGSILSQQSVAPTALWLARHEPAVWLKTRSIQGSYDWVARELGAGLFVESNWALESGLYNIDMTPLTQVQHATGIAWPELLEVQLSLIHI